MPRFWARLLQGSRNQRRQSARFQRSNSFENAIKELRPLSEEDGHHTLMMLSVFLSSVLKPQLFIITCLASMSLEMRAAQWVVQRTYCALLPVRARPNSSFDITKQGSTIPVLF